MRLLKVEDDGRVVLTEWPPSKTPRYAILSHTWGVPDQEVTFQDINDGAATEKAEYRKIEFCRKQAAADDLHYFWVDTCCINKCDLSEHSEAINSMFRWYRNAAHCYVYLADVSNGANQSAASWQEQFQQSRWFRRGWTLQELLAPASVKFFSVDGVFLGDKTSLENEIHGITKIKIPALRGNLLDNFSVHERMNWTANRQTTREEDAAYCLFGIFDMPPEANPEANPEAHLIIPFGQNDEFVGRESILTELVDKILPSTKKNDCQRTVLEGLGGIGKTQIALEAAYRVHDRDPACSVFWVPAVTLATFENACRQIGAVLGTSGMNDDKADVKALVKTALEKSVTNWLLIIDNIDDIGLLVEGGLQDCIPFNRKGSILFTTRNHEVTVRLDVSKKHTFVINEMREKEALQFLQNGLEERQYRDTQATTDLVQQLVCLPLAIKQASAYMARTRITTVRYLELCRTSDDAQMRLLNTDFEERWRYSKDTNPISMTWLISFRHLTLSCLLAVDYLKFICLLAEKDIPFSLLQPGEDEQSRDEAIGILEGYAFISVRENGDSFDIHRLVRLATRNWIKDEWEVCCTKAIGHLAEVYPFPKHENRQVWMRYMPHARLAIELHHICKNKEVAADLLFVVAKSYDEIGKYDEAEQIHRQTFELRKSVLGLKHPSTLGSMNDLALVLDSLGRYDEAEQIHRQTLELRKSVLGLEHSSTLDSLNNLSLVLDSLGRYDEAERIQLQTLELKKSVLGLKHPSTLDSMNNLAAVLDSLGRYDEAEQMHRQTLELGKSVLGLHHPSTLDSVNNLALVLRSLGRYDEAEQMHRQELELRTSVLGLEHPSTLGSMNNLAVVLRKLERYDESEQMHRQTLELRKSVLGLKHPSTLNSMNNLALVLDNLGRYDEAEQMHRQELELTKSVLGLKHPSTLISMNNLALVLDNLGRYDEAEQMYRQELELTKSVLGLKHPSTLGSMNNLAVVLENLGRYDEAEQIHRQTLELKKSVLGLEHPSTLSSMSNLALMLDNLGRYNEAEHMRRHTLELTKSVLGPDHPSTIRSQDNLRDFLDSLNIKDDDFSTMDSDESESEGGVAL